MVLDLIKQGHPNAAEKVSCSAAILSFPLTSGTCIWLVIPVDTPTIGTGAWRVGFSPAHGCLIVQTCCLVLRCGTSGPYSLTFFRLWITYPLMFNVLEHMLCGVQIGNCLRAIQVRTHMEGGSVCFHLMRSDGTLDDLSTNKCLATLFPKWGKTRAAKVRVPCPAWQRLQSSCLQHSLQRLHACPVVPTCKSPIWSGSFQESLSVPSAALAGALFNT